jgi:hypothetical protein
MDLERQCVIERALVTFPSAGNYRYKIETSDDRDHWHVAVDESQTLDASPTRNDSFAPGTRGRFVRIVFTDLPAKLPARIREVRVVGKVDPQ